MSNCGIYQIQSVLTKNGLMSYSQNQEEETIKNYFQSAIGVILDIGANDGKTLSNSLACIERGWGAVLIEPSKTAFDKAVALHKDNKSVELMNIALSNTSGEVTFYESGTHLGNGDTSLLSTLDKNELMRWAGSGNQFTETKCNSETFAEMLAKCQYKKFDVISIDAEGVDFDILKQIDLTEVGCRMLIVETNGKNNDRYIMYCERHSMKLYDKSPENLIFVR